MTRNRIRAPKGPRLRATPPAWAANLKPTTAELDALGEAGDAAGQLAGSMFRTATAAMYVLAEEGVALDASGMTDGQYIKQLAYAVASLKEMAARRMTHRAAHAASLLTAVQVWFEQVEAHPDTDAVIVTNTAIAIGYHAGMLHLQDMNVFEVAAHAEKNRASRAANALEVSAAKVAWHEPALAKAVRLREQWPRWAMGRLAEAIHQDPTIPTPSYQEAYGFIRGETAAGRIKKKASA